MTADDPTLAQAASPMIAVQRLGYTFAGRDRPTIDDVSFSLPGGSWTVVAGPTGSGKSTLLRALAGLVPHLARGTMRGVVRIGGVDTRGVGPARSARVVGFVTQSRDDLLCATTVEAELAFGLENLNLPVEEIGRRIADVARRFGFGESLSQPTAQLSGGWKQRLALAAVVAMRPQVLICDEPLSCLDPPAARAFLDELARLHRAGLTIVTAEHRVDELRPYADRELTLVEGRIVGDRPIDATASWSPRVARSRPAPTPGPAVLVVADGEFRFRGAARSVWSRVSFEVRRGERWAVVGPNGSGKSTLLAAVAGLLRWTSGRCEIFGDARRSATSLVPQRADLTLFHRSVADELAYAPRAAGLAPSTVDERVGLTARMFRLDRLLDEHPHALSRGERVRTAVAAALAAAPRLLLLDEPTTGQDLPTIDEVMELLSYCIGGPGGPEALLFSTHDLTLATRYADRVLVVCGDGQVVQARPEQLLDDEGLLRRAGLFVPPARQGGA